MNENPVETLHATSLLHCVQRLYIVCIQTDLISVISRVENAGLSSRLQS
jgi:hypothetical protein